MSIGTNAYAVRGRLIFSVFLYYAFALFLLEYIKKQVYFNVNKLSNIGRVTTNVINICLVIVLFQNIVFSNGAYITQKIIFDRSLSAYDRVLDEMYKLPDYQHNQSPVVILGDVSLVNYVPEISEGYREWFPQAFKGVNTTYYTTTEKMMRYLGEEVQLVTDSEMISKISSMDSVKEMNEYPKAGFCKMIDGNCVIKFPY